jgi:putative ABC transport system permease protein
MVTFRFKEAWRNFVRTPTFSFLNVFGFAIGLTAFVLMALYIEDELSFDTFLPNASHIYRIADDKKTPNAQFRNAESAAPVAPALLAEFAEVKAAVRLKQTEGLVRYNDKIFEERNIMFADADFFKVFQFNMQSGDPLNALRDPSTVVLTASTARKYFGDTNPLGKSIDVDKQPMTITGIVQDVPSNSHIQFDFLISMETARQNSGYSWMFTNWYSDLFYTYILVQDKQDIHRLAAKMPAFDARHREAGSTTVHQYAFERLDQIYLHSDRNGQIGKTGSISRLWIFSIVAIFILLLACVNFINLATARAASRAKEVAVKKISGAARGTIMTQFFSESLITCAVAFIISLACVSLLLPAFNNFSGKAVGDKLFSWSHLATAGLFLLCISLVSGFYPALLLSRFKAVNALKGYAPISSRSVSTRKALVVFQFSISCILIVCSLVVYTQMKYVQEHDLGFASGQTMVINFEGDPDVQQRLTALRESLLQIPGVAAVSAASSVPGDGNGGGWSMDVPITGRDTIHTEMPVYSIDYNYLSQLKIDVVAGRALSQEYAADSVSSMLINETAARTLGFVNPKDVIGTKVGMYPKDATIVGVVKDFNVKSLQQAIAPLAMRVLPFNFRRLLITLKGGEVSSGIASIEATWKKMIPFRPIDYSFLNETFNRQYAAEQKFGQVFTMFTFIAIVIACVGLFGLALFSVHQRTKEIGVRKVLGATVLTIVYTLTRDFMRLVLIAAVIALPIGYYAMQQWLQTFAYRTPFNWWIFAVAVCSALGIALLTIAWHTINAARANPVKSLRSE